MLQANESQWNRKLISDFSYIKTTIFSIGAASVSQLFKRESQIYWRTASQIRLQIISITNSIMAPKKQSSHGDRMTRDLTSRNACRDIAKFALLFYLQPKKARKVFTQTIPLIRREEDENVQLLTLFAWHRKWSCKQTHWCCVFVVCFAEKKERSELQIILWNNMNIYDERQQRITSPKTESDDCQLFSKLSRQRSTEYPPQVVE